MSNMQQLALSELNMLIRNAVDSAFPQFVWVKAEIGEVTVTRAGHCYLELVDTDHLTGEVTARARATIWSYSFRMLKPYFESSTGRTFGGGLKILVNAKIEYHVVYGLSLNIRDVDPAYTLGDMALKRREIIRRLQNEGVWEMNKEMTLPVAPQRIAVISSPTAAGLQDFMQQLHGNPYGIRFYTKLFGAAMQGAETAPSIIRALEQVSLYDTFFDVVVIIRGGGSQLDLASFDNYELSLNVAQFPLPVITGIGHDKDETILDMVAHTKLKTPTAVAEFLIDGAVAFWQRLHDFDVRVGELLSARLEKESKWLRQAGQKMKENVRRLVKKREFDIKLAAINMNNSILSFLQRREERLTKCRRRLQMGVIGKISSRHNYLTARGGTLRFTSRRLLDRNEALLNKVTYGLKSRLTERTRIQQKRISAFEEKVRLVDPLQVLKRGYSITYKDGKLLKSVKDAQSGGHIFTRLCDGVIQSAVTGNHNHLQENNTQKQLKNS